VRLTYENEFIHLFENNQNELNFRSKSSSSEILDILDKGYGERSGYHTDKKADQG
jgi:hypothetical protein